MIKTKSKDIKLNYFSLWLAPLVAVLAGLFFYIGTANAGCPDSKQAMLFGFSAGVSYLLGVLAIIYERGK
jgi:FtsH-binding integral membrane protein